MGGHISHPSSCTNTIDRASFPFEDSNRDLVLPLLFYDSTKTLADYNYFAFLEDVCVLHFRSPVSYEDEYIVNAKVVCSCILILAVLTNLLHINS